MNISRVTKGIFSILLAMGLTIQVQAQYQEQDMSDTKKDIVDLAMENENLSKLTEAVKEADMVETLKADGPYTVFAPTDSAFEALPEGTWDELLKPENKEQLQAVLSYHVVPGEVNSQSLSTMKVKTVQGSEAKVDVSGKSVKIDGASVKKADIEASNGVVHIIDEVILPQSVEEELASADTKEEMKSSDWK